MAMYHVKEATLDIFFRELEADEGKVFEELVEKKVGDGVLEMIEELCGKVLNVVGDVEGPDSDSEGEDLESDVTSDGDYSPGDEDSDEDDDFEEDESMDEESVDNSGEYDAGRRVDLPNSHRAGEHHSNAHHGHHDHHNHHDHKTLHAVQFLEAAKLMIASLTQPELWAVLDECRKIVELSCGRKVVFPPSLLTDRPGLEKSGTYHPGGLGDAVVSALSAYRHHVTENHGAIEEHMYHKAQDFIDFVKERNEMASGVRRDYRWLPEKEKVCSGNCGEECVCVVACMLVSPDDKIVNRVSDEEDTNVFENTGSRVLFPIDEDPEAEAESEDQLDVVVREGHMLVMTEDGDFEDFSFQVETPN